MIDKRTFFLFLFCLRNYRVSGYNLDTENAKVFRDPTGTDLRRGSYFGFATALYVGEDSRAAVLVGAPRGNVTSQPDIREPGTVYRCLIEGGGCKEWLIDDSPNGWDTRHTLINAVKDNAWTGATIAVENRTEARVVVCAPRWKNNPGINNRPSWYMNGICYWKTARNVRSFDTEADQLLAPLLSPSEQVISTNRINIYNFGMGQAGFSMSMSSNDLRWDVALGSPGVFNSKGAVILHSQYLLQGVRTVLPQIRKKQIGRDYSYFGYSITSGAYFRKGDYLYASGAPRSADLYGQVLIFSFPGQTKRSLIVRKALDGQKLGEYFGASLSSCDLNGDGKDELIVGAPSWSRDVDEGRIYVFTARYNENLDTQVYEAEAARGRFGTTITCLGDIDYDGYQDLAVGAPYEADNTGAVYIFNGNSVGLPRSYSQRIVGSRFGIDVRGFGISISVPRDVNRDNYSDIAVGAHLSERVVLIRSRPVVTMNVKLAYAERKKLSRNTTRFTIESCVSYDGAYAPEEIRIVQVLNVDQMYGRALYDGIKSINHSYNLPDTLYRAKTNCRQFPIKLKENIQSIDPIEISTSVVLDETNKVENNEIFACTSCAVANKYFSKTEDLLKLPFAIDCGDDDVCVSDMKLTLSTNLHSGDRYIIGSEPTMKLTINVSNEGEPAYQAKVYVYIPAPLTLATVPSQCMESSYVNGSLELICDIGNPLRANGKLEVEVDMREVKYGVDRIEFWANATTQSEETSPLDNSYNLTLYLDADIDIAIAGKAQQDLYSYLDKDGNKQLSDIQFQHVYEVQKFGASPIEEAVLLISVPVYWKDTTTDLPLVNVNQTTAYMDGQEIYCTDNTEVSAMTDTGFDQLIPPALSKLAGTHEKFTIEEDVSVNLPPENRSVYLNCSSTAIECKTIECKLGPFLSSLSVARISLTMDLRLSVFKMEMMEEKDIIFLTTEGSVRITQPPGIRQRANHKPDNATVATTFLGSPIAQRVANWIIVLSVFLGIVLLILLILGLIRLGFFHRKKREELEAMKAETDKAHGIVLETSSSQEVLDQE